uniref:C-C motif chemokine n=2 Tax=Pelodiscus sinensis TaxID=13735 RepID=K7FD18_PELSI|nr:C-C motif chemokine 4-like isoform X1 [Pelodiscus sinensis]|eukprot:XP_014425412.1 C-C motif chemokine 4-like isoform X1 [Pelodiscus sinensis]
MKVSVAALAVLASAAFCSLASSAPLGLDRQTSCCFSHSARPIPRRMVLGYYDTSGKCTLPAIVLITKKGRPICADPGEAWVQGLRDQLDRN